MAEAMRAVQAPPVVIDVPMQREEVSTDVGCLVYGCPLPPVVDGWCQPHAEMRPASG